MLVTATSLMPLYLWVQNLKTPLPFSCALIDGMTHYTYLANQIWIFLEGIYLHGNIANPVIPSTDSYVVTRYAVVGWIVPSIFSIGWFIQSRGSSSTYCYEYNESLYDFNLNWWFEVQVF